MKRDALNLLKKWEKSKFRKPLIIRGARQVGKSWLVRDFSNQFENFVELNLEEEIDTHRFFEGSLNIPNLLENIQLYTQKKIIPGKTLLFIDEIQACERAILALRYFKENLPDLHVIAAGSLLDFALEKVGIPVGRVEFLHLHPLSFGEFLESANRADLRKCILNEQIDDVIHEQILTYLHRYYWLGGMPEIVNAWNLEQDHAICQNLQDQIIQTYQQDFTKYAKNNELPHLEKVFNSVPGQLGDKFKFVSVDHEARSNDIKNALSLLEKAGIIYTVYHTSAQGHPLGASTNLKKFKIFFFDIGIANRLLKLNLSSWITSKIEVKHLGAICEQLVAQEYIAYKFTTKSPEIFYWQREERNSNAEIDFIFSINSEIIPIEVKAGTRGHLKSLNLFLETHPDIKYAIKVSESNFHTENDLKCIPLYGLETLV